MRAADHFNITENFDEVLVNAMKERDSKIIYFPTEYFSNYWTNKFEWRRSNEDEGEMLKKLSTMEFSQAVHVICTLYSNSPFSLLQIAMKKVLELGMSLDRLPRELQVKAEKGLFYKKGREAWDGLDQDEWPDCLSEEGRILLEKLIRM